MFHDPGSSHHIDLRKVRGDPPESPAAYQAVCCVAYWANQEGNRRAMEGDRQPVITELVPSWQREEAA